MFGNRSSSERVLVPANEPANDDSGVDDLIEGPSGMSYADILGYMRRRKCMVACVSTGIILLCAIIITTICATAGNGPVPPSPTTPAPITTVPTTTKPSTTTSSTTTSKSTTTSPTTTSTSTTIPTTTSPTTTSTSTTTSPTTTTTSTTTRKPGPPVPTTHPLPPHPETLPPKTLLLQVGLVPNFTQVPCFDHHPPTFRFVLTIDQISKEYTADSDTKKHAETAVAMQAATDLFGVHYNYTMPPPKFECFKNATTVDNPSTITTDNV